MDKPKILPETRAIFASVAGQKLMAEMLGGKGVYSPLASEALKQLEDAQRKLLQSKDPLDVDISAQT